MRLVASLPRPWKAHRGLTLLEVLVTLVIVGMFLAVLLPGSTLAMRRLQAAQLKSQALSIASSHIEALNAWPATLPSPASGREGALLWKVEQLASLDVDGSALKGARLASYRISVAAVGDRDPLVDVTVRRLTKAE